MVSLVACLEKEGIVKWKGLKSQGPLYIHVTKLAIFRNKYYIGDIEVIYTVSLQL